MLPLQRLEALGADKQPCLDGLQLLDITVVSLTLSMQPLNISKRLKKKAAGTQRRERGRHAVRS